MLYTLLTFITISCSGAFQTDSIWNKEFSTAQEIVETYDKSYREAVGNEATRNRCHYIWNSGEYIINCRGKNEDITLLPQFFEELSLEDSTVNAFMTEKGIERFADHYFMLKAMKRGCTFDDSRDGLTATVLFPIRAINENDRTKLREIFSCNNDTLHEIFLEKMKFPFINSGCDREFAELRQLIEKNVKETPLKSEILALYDLYSNTIPGMPAPDAELKDTAGTTHTLSEFKGKILVIDVWATWCSSCIKKMPSFIALHQSYKGNTDIEFITVSIDRNTKTGHWKRAISRYGMEDLVNLFPDCAEESLFESEYHVSGIPRYIIIDKEGDIITAYAPSPGEGLEELITDILK